MSPKQLFKVQISLFQSAGRENCLIYNRSRSEMDTVFPYMNPKLDRLCQEQKEKGIYKFYVQGWFNSGEFDFDPKTVVYYANW